MKIAVVGGGPAGMLGAILAAERGHSVVLFEQNPKLGKKLYITGKGRCNICNDCTDEEFFQEVVTNKRFLYSSYYSFPSFQLMDYFQRLGLPLKVERGRRVFPKSDHASDVIRVLEKKLKENSVTVKFNSQVKSIEKKEEFVISTQKERLLFDRVLLATGGITYPACGSTGDGYSFAKSLGHTIIEPKAALVGLRTRHRGREELMGLSLKNVELIGKSGKKEKRIFGDLLFTHYGVSGPSSLSLSSYINRWDSCQLFVDLKPALTEEKLENRIIRELENEPNKGIEKILLKLSPRALIGPILQEVKIEGKTKANQISKENRRELTKIYKSFPLNYVGLFEESTGIITSGGIKVKEINPSTMESKVCQGLFFAGEIIDVDALTGGYNLQIAFSTAYLAGSMIE